MDTVKYVEVHKGCDVFNLDTGFGYSVVDMVKTFQERRGAGQETKKLWPTCAGTPGTEKSMNPRSYEE